MKTKLALLLLLTTFAAGCGKKDTPGGGGPDGKGGAAVDYSTATPDVTMKAADWHAEFKKDEKAAKAKYAGKLVELSGKVTSVVQNLDAGVVFLHLKVDGDVLGVRCGINDVNAWEKVPEGADVVVRGKLPEFGFLTGELMPVQVIRVDNNPTTTFTAADLAGQFAKEPAQLKEKWADKWVYVEGEFVRSETSKNGILQIVLKGDGKAEIKCSVGSDAKKQVEAMKPGQKVKVLGQLSVYDDVSLQMAMFRTL